MRVLRRELRRVLRWTILPLVVVVILLEDWLWDPLQRLAALIGRLPGLRRLEIAIAGLPPKGALAMFLVPSVVLFPFKLLALAAMARGMLLAGLCVAVAAKVVGTALVARIFTLCKPALLSVPWFARAHAWIGDLRARVLGWVRATAAYRAVQRVRARLAATRAGIMKIGRAHV